MKTSTQLIEMFTERKELTPKTINDVTFVDFFLTKKQAKWLESVRAREIGYSRSLGRDFIGSTFWAMSYTIHGAGQVRMTTDGSDVKTVLGPAAHIVR